MGALREYRVVHNGVETTMQLTEAHAALMGATPVETAPAGDVVDAHALVRPDIKADIPPNKARTARDKGAR